MPFHSIQLLPTDAEPLTSWLDHDKAFHDIAKGISTAIKALLLSRKTKAQQWFDEGNALHELKRYEEAVSALEQALRLDPNFAIAWYGKSVILESLNRYDEAEQAREKARQLGFVQ